jgi:hypothetical protein
MLNANAAHTFSARPTAPRPVLNFSILLTANDMLPGIERTAGGRNVRTDVDVGFSNWREI